MKKLRIKTSLLVSASAVAGLAMGAGIALAAHPPIQLYTYEEVAAQMNGTVDPLNPFSAPKMPAPVLVDKTSKQGLPYSPKQTCGATGCHDGKTVQNGATVSAKYKGKALKGYSDLADHAFHAALGYNEWMDNSDSGLFVEKVDGNWQQTGLNPQKPWLQSHGHNGKW